VDKGAEYINLLLAHPARETSVFEVVCGSEIGIIESAANTGLDHDDIEEGYQVSVGVPLGDAGVVADRKAIQQYRGRFNELVSEKADAEADGDHERLEEIQIEMAQLVAAVTGAQGKGGKLRKVADRRKKRPRRVPQRSRPGHQADRQVRQAAGPTPEGLHQARQRGGLPTGDRCHLGGSSHRERVARSGVESPA
jgi:hypothetical protein